MTPAPTAVTAETGETPCPLPGEREHAWELWSDSRVAIVRAFIPSCGRRVLPAPRRAA